MQDCWYREDGWPGRAGSSTREAEGGPELSGLEGELASPTYGGHGDTAGDAQLAVRRRWVHQEGGRYTRREVGTQGSRRRAGYTGRQEGGWVTREAQK